MQYSCELMHHHFTFSYMLPVCLYYKAVMSNLLTQSHSLRCSLCPGKSFSPCVVLSTCAVISEIFHVLGIFSEHFINLLASTQTWKFHEGHQLQGQGDHWQLQISPREQKENQTEADICHDCPQGNPVRPRRRAPGKQVKKRTL